jgi:hypothetical protein
MDKIKIFLSSRVNSSFKKLDPTFSLADLRGFLKKELAGQTFFDEQILDVKINEESFDSTIAKDAFDNCMSVMRSCNVIIILYNGEAGWAIAGSGSANGICHEEFLIAANEFSDMSFILDLSEFFDSPTDVEAQKRNALFAKDVGDFFQHRTSVKAKDADELKVNVLAQVRQYVLKAIEKAFATQKAVVSGASVFGDTLDWSKLNYAERKKELEKNLETAFGALPGFEGVIKAYHGIPDNMAVADARGMIGRPFLYEHNDVEGSSFKSGVIHFVAVYGNATATQIKGLVGYPDLTVIKASFGFYLWEHTTHIQLFFLKSCINPQTVRTRYSEVANWLSSSREQANVLARAGARYSILEAINKANGIG